jgi:hypothetical protein
MKTERIRHGELDIREIAGEPDLAGYEEEKGPRLIVGHSETGACHVIESDTAKLFRAKGKAVAYLCLVAPEKLKHDGHRHTTEELKSGWHEIITKRQYEEDGSWSPIKD